MAKEPLYRMTIEVSYNEYLGLLWALDGIHNVPAQKNTIRKIAAHQRAIKSQYEDWRAANFKCAQKRSK
jgi:hypothetical protein